ncbi:MAG TPA: hypothetical protein VEY51_06600 [Chondromyces sp.]|nr:hypothetical protein [Chondromyces sp.]
MLNIGDIIFQLLMMALIVIFVGGILCISLGFYKHYKRLKRVEDKLDQLNNSKKIE